MANSSRFTQLELRLDQLETNLIPPVNPTGNYSSKELDQTRSYCLLTHAEFEAYFEDILLEVLNKSYDYWVADKSKIPSLIFNLVCFFKIKKESKDSAATLIHQAVKHLKDMIDKNHGIKAHNVEGLFSPIGYAIDSTLLTDLDNFGKTRGDIAHTSFKTHQIIDPVSEKNTVSNIKRQLKKFDEEFYKLISANPVALLGAKSIKGKVKHFSLQVKLYFKGLIAKA